VQNIFRKLALKHFSKISSEIGVPPAMYS